MQEIYLKKTYPMPPGQEFYCPKCNVCIEKVLFFGTRDEPLPSQPIRDFSVRCSACFSILNKKDQLAVVGAHLRPKAILDRLPADYNPRVHSIWSKFDLNCVEVEALHMAIDARIEKTDPLGLRLKSLCIRRSPEAKWVPSDRGRAQPGRGNVAGRRLRLQRRRRSRSRSSPSPSRSPGSSMLRGSKEWEIVKSFVNGGLAGLIASLSTVAASAGATTSDIFPLAIVNLIGGLFLLIGNLIDRQAIQPREEEDATDTFFLHALVAFLSFLTFGILPPVLYGFSFRESDDKHLNLEAVTEAFLIGIVVLVFANPYFRLSEDNFMEILKKFLLYVGSVVLASGSSALLNSVGEQHGWFEPKSNIGLSPPKMIIENPRWRLY